MITVRLDGSITSGMIFEGNGGSLFLKAQFSELRSRKTVRFSKQTMSADKYPSIFPRQMEAIVYLVW